MNPDTIGCVSTGEFDLDVLDVWTGKFLNLERKSCGFKNIRIRVDEALMKLSLCYKSSNNCKLNETQICVHLGFLLERNFVFCAFLCLSFFATIDIFYNPFSVLLCQRCRSVTYVYRELKTAFVNTLFWGVGVGGVLPYTIGYHFNTY